MAQDPPSGVVCSVKGRCHLCDQSGANGEDQSTTKGAWPAFPFHPPLSSRGLPYFLVCSTALAYELRIKMIALLTESDIAFLQDIRSEAFRVHYVRRKSVYGTAEVRPFRTCAKFPCKLVLARALARAAMLARASARAAILV